MPGGDRRGPMGEGPRTGRALGYCSGYNSPGYTKGRGMGLGRGMAYRHGGRGRGFGRGYSRDYYADEVYDDYAAEEKAYLEDTIVQLEDELAAMKKRISELEAKKKAPETPDEE